MLKEIETARLNEVRAFQREGPTVAKDLVWVIVVITRGTNRTCQSKERSDRCEVAEVEGSKCDPKDIWSNTMFERKNQNKNFEFKYV